MAEEGRPRRWQRFESSLDPLQALRTSIAQVRSAPLDPEARRQLRAIAAEQGLWEELALLLADEARAAASPAVGAAFHEELADVHENLDQLLDAITAMERVVELAPDAAPHHDRLGRLYHRAGAALKAAAAFERVAELGAGERALAALRAAAALYRDHNKLDRAAAAFRGIIERRAADATAWAALDEVLHALGRWQELAALRGERARRAESNVERATLLRAQARALEQAGDLAGAAEVISRAAHHAPENVSGMVDYADVLARSGQGREAAEILAARVAEAIAREATVDDIAALRLRLAHIYDEACGDPAAAAATLAQLVADAPTYLPAREWMAARAARDPDPRVHGAALLKYADALGLARDAAFAGEREAVVAAAARRFIAGGDHRAAVRAFELATELAPDDEAIRDELEAARVALVVEKAAAERESGDLAGAERRLRAVLGSQPHHVAANLALAETLVAADRTADAAEHLRGALADAPDDSPGERLAPLVHRCATLLAALGESDESHQLLHEAHRLDRRSLPITLALGESCFARKIWRQAALHLGGLATHPDAAAHAAAVAAGLVHAAQAEVRALRPANAPAHYEAALALDPACGPAWHALAEQAIEQGDLARAADCLEREATATAAPADRLRLFDALGDMAKDVLGDPERAERCWLAVADAGAAGVLEKLLALQRARSPGSARGETCERLAALRTDPREIAALLVEAADAFDAAGDAPRARALAERLMAIAPKDVDALLAATGVAASDPATVREWLKRGLAALDATGDRGKRDPKRGELWRRLGDAERDADDEKAAAIAYRRAVNIAPASEAAVGARRALVELAATSGADAQSSLIALVEFAQDPFDLLAWARGLVRAGEHEDARAAYDLARAVGAKLSADDERALAAHPPRLLASDEAYAEVLPEAERRALVDDAAEGPLGDLLELLAEAQPLVAPDAKTALAAAGLADAKRLPAASDAAALATYPQIAKAFGGPQTLLHATARGTAPDLTLLFASPVVLVLGPRLASVRAGSRSDLDVVADAGLRFALGRVVELARPRRLAAAGQSPAAFARFVAAIAHAFGGGGAPSPEVVAEAERLRARIPIALRQRLVERLAGGPALDAAACAAYRAACERAADRLGLLACGDAAAAIAAAGGPDHAPHLVQLAATQRYLAARKQLRARAADDPTAPFRR